MSYSALRGELDPLLLNRALAQEGRLVLPRVEEQGLAAYLIACPSKDLTLSPLGVLEPTPSLCRPVTPLDLTTVLVPGLSFDAKQHRLGYGKGYYDRFLASVPEVLAIGVGFTEQYADALPVEPHDLALKKLLLL
jgi:5-formyltetrahydrofolate cyclo-ligase